LLDSRAMKIDRDEATRIARLARLEFDAQGLDRMAADMTAILAYVEQLRDVDVAREGAGELQRETPLRDDVRGEQVSRDAVAANAPAWQDGFFVVPPVIGGES
jgi:aspartyl-tRNA(Asn)/glutamyl-tRNA(Gln) amidotransferase subunit C